MPRITREERNQEFGPDGQLVSSEPVQVDVTAETNGKTLQDQARAALAANRTFLGVATPTNAQVVAQVRALTRQMNGVARLLLGDLDDVD